MLWVMTWDSSDPRVWGLVLLNNVTQDSIISHPCQERREADKRKLSRLPPKVHFQWWRWWWRALVDHLPD
jgi:hypothetical protein